MKYRKLINRLILGMAGVASVGCFTACEQEFFEDEQYRKEILIVSGDDNIVQREFSFEDDAVGYISIYASGVTPIEKDVTVELAKDGNILQEYNQRMHGEDYASYALELPESCYEIDNWSIQVHPDETTPYSMFPIKVNLASLQVEETYFLPLKIVSVSDYMISAEKQEALLQIMMKNDYASTLTATYYSMNGTSSTNGGAESPVNISKLVVPVSKYGIRILPGSVTTTDKKEIRMQGIVVTVHPDELIDVPVIGEDGLPTGETVKRQKVTLERWRNLQDAITVNEIADKPSYYDPEEGEYTLNYTYSYGGNNYVMYEVMSRMSITNEDNND